MSTLEREVAVDADRPHPSTSLALVPLTGDAARPRQVTRAAGPPNAHRWFYGIGYAGLALIALGAWVAVGDEELAIPCFLFGGLFLGLGGLGVAIHVLYKPTMQKLRMGLGAVASVALTLAALTPLTDVARAVQADGRVARLQPLADELARDGRVQTLGISRADYVELNGSRTALNGSMASSVESGEPLLIDDLLRRNRFTMPELLALMDRLRQAGVQRVEVRPGYVALDATRGAPSLLYVRPGHPLPSPGTEILDATRRSTEPLGGGWYVQRMGRGWWD